MSGCLTSEQFERLVAEQLEAEQRRILDTHIDACPACQQKLTQLLEEDEGEYPGLDWQRLRPAGPENAGQSVADLLRRLKEQLSPATVAAARPQHEAGPCDIRFPEPPTEQGPLGRLESYHIVAERGRGAFGVVFQAYDDQLRCTVALKVLKPEAAANATDRARFEGEARKAAAVRHEHVVTIHRVGHSPSFALPYFVMEYIDGEALSDRLRRQGTLPAREAVELVRQVALGLAAAHARGLIHRDINPANLLVEKATGRVKITDFGLARSLEVRSERLTQSGGIVGTPPYMSPEQITAPTKVDQRSDLYSLGVVLYELLTGERPFRGQPHMILHQVVHEEPRPPHKLDDAIPRDLETITFKCLAKEPARRYQTAQELADDLARGLEGKPTHARPVGRVEQLWLWCRRNPTVASLTGIAILLLALVAVGSAASSVLIWRQSELTKAAKIEAETAKLQVEENLDIAYRVLDDIYLDMAERRLPDVHALPQDRPFLQKALTFYEHIAKQQSTEPRVRRQTALAYLRLGSTQALLGNQLEAKEKYHQARVLLEALAREYPNDVECRHHLARCLADMADTTNHPLYFDTIAENAQALRQAVGLLEGLAKEFPTHDDYQRDLAESYARLGARLDPDRAEKMLRAALAIRGKLAEEHPTQPNHQQDLGDSLGRLGERLMYAGKLEEAEQLYRRGLDLRKKIVTDFPSLGIHRYYLTWGFMQMADLLQKTGRLQEAEENLRQEVAVFRKVLEDFPGVPLFQGLYYAGLSKLAEVVRQMRRFEDAEQLDGEVETIRRGLKRDYPAVALYCLAWQEQGYPEVLVPPGDYSRIGLNSFLLALNPFNWEAYLERGRLYDLLRDLHEAIAGFSLALALMPPGHKAYGEALFRRSNNYRRLQDLPRADADLQQILAQDLDLPAHLRPGAALLCNHLALRCLAHSAMQQGPNKALLLARKAVKLAPNECLYQSTLGIVLYRLGQYPQAMEALEHSLRDSKGDTAAINLFFLAMCYACQADTAKAKDCYERAVHLLEEQPVPFHPRWKEELDAIRAEAKALLQARSIGGP